MRLPYTFHLICTVHMYVYIGTLLIFPAALTLQEELHTYYWVLYTCTCTYIYTYMHSYREREEQIIPDATFSEDTEDIHVPPITQVASPTKSSAMPILKLGARQAVY